MKTLRKLMRTIVVLGGSLAALLLAITGCAVGKTDERTAADKATVPVLAAQSTPAPKKVKKPLYYARVRGQMKPVYDGEPPREIEIIRENMDEIAQAAAKIPFNPQAATLADVMVGWFNFREHESSITKLQDNFTQYAANAEYQISIQSKDASSGIGERQRLDRRLQLTNQALNTLSELHKNANLLINPVQKEIFAAALVRHQQLVGEVQTLINQIAKDDQS